MGADHSGPLSGLRVLAVGTDWRTGPRAVHALRRAGCHVISADRAGAGFLHGRSMRSLRVRRHPDPELAPEQMASWVETQARALRVDAVVPVSEDATRVCAMQNLDLGSARLAGPTHDQFHALCDKGMLGVTAARVGVSHPETRIVDTVEECAGMTFPVIVKSSEGIGVDSLPAGVGRVDTQDELDVVAGEIIASGAHVVVQEFITGEQWSAHIVRDGEKWAGLSAIITHRSPRGAGTPTILRVTPREDVWLQAVKLLAEVDYRGGANVQFIDRDGELFVHDVNLRSPATVIMPIRAGLDVPAMGLAAALGLPWQAPETFEPVTYLWLESELKEAARARSVRDLMSTLAMIPQRNVVLDPNPLDPWYIARFGARVVRAVRKRLPGT